MSLKDRTNPAVILKKPHITEKATFMTGNKKPVYTFQIPKEAGKIDVKRAIKAKYQVEALKVNIVNLPKKSVWVRRIKGKTAAIKKALVVLPAGTDIDFI